MNRKMLKVLEVAAFKREADERGTPFVEVDKAVCDYVNGCGDSCVQKRFSRCIKEDGDVVVLFPFKRLAHSFVIVSRKPVDVEKEWRSNENVRLLSTAF